MLEYSDTYESYAICWFLYADTLTLEKNMNVYKTRSTLNAIQFDITNGSLEQHRRPTKTTAWKRPKGEGVKDKNIQDNIKSTKSILETSWEKKKKGKLLSERCMI